MEENHRIRIMVVDDHLVVRQGFATFLKAFDDLELVGEASNGQEAIQKIDQLNPDVILMDMVMPRLGGAETIKAIRQTHPSIQIIALTSFTNDKQLLQNALEAGAIGYLFKDVSIEALANAIRAAYEGNPIMSPEAMRMLILTKTQRVAGSFNLSERELEVLQLLVKGLTNNEIAEHLSVSRSTIKYHVSSILGKLGANSRAEAVSIAHQHKLVT
ncbi:MAG: response regulator transcription factor [Anaerolineae bacterium]